MATAKKGIIDSAMDSAAMKKAKGMVDSAMSTMGEAFGGSAPAPRKAPKRASTKTVRKTPAKKAAAKKMDRKLVSTMELYEVQYLARKHGVTQKAVKDTVSRVGHSRAKVEAELKRGK